MKMHCQQFTLKFCTSHKLTKSVRPGVPNLGYMHRRTRRGVGGRGRPPGLENFQGKLCFQDNRKFLKNPES